MIVRILPDAEADLEAISDYIAKDNPRRAATFVEELRQVCENLGYMPEAFPLLPSYRHLGIRHRVHGRYQVFYRIVGKPARVDVLRVIHGARDYVAILFPGDA